MAYIINKTDGNTAFSPDGKIIDGDSNNSTSLVLFGKGYSGFGEYLNENLIALQQEGGFSQEELSTLVANSFKASWLTSTEKDQYLAGLNDYLAKCA